MQVLPTNFESETLEDGKVIVYGVPIFAVCEKDGIEFSEAWIDKAVQYHRAGEANGSAWAMHIHHTGEEGRQVLQAGAWTNTRRGKIKTKSGKVVDGVLADLIFTNQEAAERARRWELLWRSPEIPLTAALGKTEPRFKSLALLDRDAPHNDDLPVLTFTADTVRFRNTPPTALPWERVDSELVVAFGASTQSIWALMEPHTMPDDTKKNDDDVKLQDDGDSTPPESEGSETKDEGEKSSGWKAALDALKSTEIATEDIPEVVAAVREFADSLGGDAEPEPEEEMPENIEGGAEDPTTPLKDTSEVVKLRDEVVALKADLIAERKLREKRDADAAFDKAVDEAFARLEGKGVKRDEIVAFADGAKGMARASAVTKLANELDKRLLERTADFERYVETTEQDVPDAVLKFRDQGPDAYEWAIGKSRTHKALRESGNTDLSLERYLEISKPGSGFARQGTEV